MIRVVLSTVFTIATAGVLTAAELSPALVDPYVRVQSALAADTFDSVKADAVEIGKAAMTLGEPAQPLVKAAKRLEDAPDLKAARQAFGQLSDSLFAYVKATGAAMPAGVKTAYCPMVNKSWLQKGDKIQNPYYGSEMLECGSFR
jgi:Cu(I)/Ag(I) efflux system membrane fusion protein